MVIIQYIKFGVETQIYYKYSIMYYFNVNAEFKSRKYFANVIIISLKYHYFIVIMFN